MKDVQNQSDNRGVEIQKVGIKDFELPIVIQRKDAEDKVIYASATCGVSLPAHYKGTHMSRFVEVLNEWREEKTLDIRDCVEKMVEKLYNEWLENATADADIVNELNAKGNNIIIQEFDFENLYQLIVKINK